MTKYLTGLVAAAAVATSLAFAFPAHSATDSACKKLWSQADRDKNRSVSMTEARIAMAGKTGAARSADANKDGKLTASEFLTACKKGMFDKKG